MDRVSSTATHPHAEPGNEGRRTAMRTALVPLLALSCGWLSASAQVPQPQKGPPPIVIAPQTGTAAAPQTTPGVIVIRPGAQPALANPPAAPGVPTLTTPGVPAQPAAAPA